MNNEEQERPAWMFWLAIAALVAGLGIGLATLAAPAGVWVGLWPFNTGFAILQATNPWTSWIAIVCLLAAVALLILARQWNTSDGPRLAGFAAIGAVAAGIAWFIPSTFQGDFPPIHDVSTDTDNPPRYVAILPLRADAPNPTDYGISRAVPQEEHAQVQREAYPDLVTRRYDAGAGEVFDQAMAAVEEMGWEVVDASEQDGRIEAVDTTFWFRFKDDIVIRIRSQAGQTLLDARSLSRVGVGDVGANAQRLREFFAVMDQQ